MANIKSMKKDIRRNAKRRVRNLAAKSALKTYVKKLRTAATGTETTEIKEAANRVNKAMDKAVQRGIIHKNQAARRKSRAMKAANKASAAKS